MTTENLVTNTITENIITEPTNSSINTDNYSYGILFISSIFLLLTIIYLITSKKSQLKIKKKNSKY